LRPSISLFSSCLDDNGLSNHPLYTYLRLMAAIASDYESYTAESDRAKVLNTLDWAIERASSPTGRSCTQA
jgi:hypothetical protein